MNTATQVLSIASALAGAGGILTLSVFDIPELRSQPADRSLPIVRWLFSRGSHIFPTASVISSAGFAYLAYHTLPSLTVRGLRGNGYAAAALFAFSICPFTAVVMIPNNFALIEKNEQLGGSRSAANAGNENATGHSALDSVNSKGMVSQWTDLSDPQTKTRKSSTVEDDKQVRDMLDKFQMQNTVRAVLLGTGGIIGLMTALG